MRSNNVYIQLYYERCDPSNIKGIKCANDNAYYWKVKNIFWYAEYSSLSIDPTNYKMPLKRERKTQPPFYVKYATLSLVPVEFNTDDGWLLSSKKTESALSPNNFVSEYGGYDETQVFVLSIAIAPDKIVYDRHYDKIQDVLARVVGLVSSLTVVFRLITIPYAKSKILELIIKEFFEINIKPRSRPDADHKLAAKPREASKSPSSDSQASPSENKQNKIEIELQLSPEHEEDHLPVELPHFLEEFPSLKESDISPQIPSSPIHKETYRNLITSPMSLKLKSEELKDEPTSKNMNFFLKSEDDQKYQLTVKEELHTLKVRGAPRKTFIRESPPRNSNVHLEILKSDFPQNMSISSPFSGNFSGDQSLQVNSVNQTKEEAPKERAKPQPVSLVRKIWRCIFRRKE